MDGLVQERRNSIANALELHISCTNPSIYNLVITVLAYIPGHLTVLDHQQNNDDWNI